MRGREREGERQYANFPSVNSALAKYDFVSFKSQEDKLVTNSMFMANWLLQIKAALINRRDHSIIN
jgi:hypothetical protein